MRIVLFASSAPVTCPYCRDALGAGAHAACKKCGTLYHQECAGLAGACGLIGCDGALSGARGGAEDARLALVLRPGFGEPGPEQLRAVARVLDAMEWDARQRLLARVPLVLGYFPRPALAHATAELERAGLSFFAIEAAALARRERFAVREIALDGGALLLFGPEGQRSRLDLRAPRTVVVARYATETDEVRDLRPDVDDPGGYASSRSKRKVRAHTSKLTRVLHVYPGTPVPFVFEEGTIATWQFLGSSMTASSTQNFLALEALLVRGAPRVARALEKIGTAHMAHVSDSARRRGAVTTNRVWVDAASLLVFHSHELEREPEPEKGA